MLCFSLLWTVVAHAAEGCDLDGDGVADAPLDVAWYSDADGDGFGAGPAVGFGCDLPAYVSVVHGDCDDGAAEISPEGVELAADGVDQDCDGGDLCWVDLDRDGFGSRELEVDDNLDCDDGSTGTAGRTGDCADAEYTRSPATAEVCDGIDNDCDGKVDVGPVDGRWYWVDRDGDGYGGATGGFACALQGNFVTIGGDCNDSQPYVHPDQLEACGGEDEDCDGLNDEQPAIGDHAWFADLDGDGYGDPTTVVKACERPEGYLALGRTNFDCDDQDPARTLCPAIACDAGSRASDLAGPALALLAAGRWRRRKA